MTGAQVIYMIEDENIHIPIMYHGEFGFSNVKVRKTVVGTRPCNAEFHPGLTEEVTESNRYPLVNLREILVIEGEQ